MDPFEEQTRGEQQLAGSASPAQRCPLDVSAEATLGHSAVCGSCGVRRSIPHVYVFSKLRLKL